MFAREPIAAPRNLPISASAACALSVARTSVVHESPRVGSRSPQLDRGPIRRRSRRQRLDVAVAVAVPLTGRAADLQNHVSELRPTAEEPAVEDDTAPHSRSERQHHEVRSATARTELPLGQRRGVPVVLDAHRQSEAGPGMADEIEVAEREIDRAQQAARRAIEVRRDAVAEGAYALVDEALDGLVESADHLALRAFRRLDLVPRMDSPVAIDDAGERLRPAEVDADHELRRGAHGRGLP